SMPPKYKDHPDLISIVIDTGNSMSEREVEEARKAADWIISRKIDKASNDGIQLIVSGTHLRKRITRCFDIFTE
ncbi:hypothetical protein PFISCL1PPCAC_24401, partial [Pristionchus fissidentatus]